MTPEIDTRDARMSPDTLARFADGLSWPRIMVVTHGRVADWWRDVVGNAEDAGLLWWDRKQKVWRLTDAGRELVRASAKGRA